MFDTGYQGFGMSTEQDLVALNKALSAGYGTSPDTQTGGGALRVESLEASLKTLTYTDEHIKFWKRIPKLTATNTVEEYNQLISYGSEGGGFIPEGELPDSEDTNYQRRAAFVKFLGTTRQVTHPMSIVRSSIGDVIAQENKNGILWMLKKLEYALFWGNSKLAKGGTEYVEFDGLDRQIDPQNTIDLKGQHLDEQTINWGAQMILENYGIPTDLHLPYEVLAQFNNDFLPKERIILPSQNGYTAGVPIQAYNTHGGPVQLLPNIFLRKTEPLPTAATSPLAPAAPTLDAPAQSTQAGDFAKSGGAGNYKYAITACNRHGESAPSNVQTFNLTDASKGVNLSTTGYLPGNNDVDYFNIYRSEKDGNTLYRIARVAATANGQLQWTDTNYRMPNTYTAFMGQMDSSVISFKQLSPLIKMDLAVLGPAYRWMLLLYGVPILYAPRKWMRFINIKVDSPINN